MNNKRHYDINILRNEDKRMYLRKVSKVILSSFKSKEKHEE